MHKEFENRSAGTDSIALDNPYLMGISTYIPNVNLDFNGDGKLDFNEFLVLYGFISGYGKTKNSCSVKVESMYLQSSHEVTTNLFDICSQKTQEAECISNAQCMWIKEPSPEEMARAGWE